MLVIRYKRARAALKATRAELEEVGSTDRVPTSSRVRQWKDLDRQVTEHLDRGPCVGFGCTVIDDLSREMHDLWSQMTEAERQQC